MVTAQQLRGTTTPLVSRIQRQQVSSTQVSQPSVIEEVIEQQPVQPTQEEINAQQEYDRKVAEYEKQKAIYEGQLKEYQEYEQGRSMARRGKFDPYMTPAMRQGYSDEINKIQAREASAGWREPVKPTEVTGYEIMTPTGGMSIGKAEYDKIPKPTNFYNVIQPKPNVLTNVLAESKMSVKPVTPPRTIKDTARESFNQAFLADVKKGSGVKTYLKEYSNFPGRFIGRVSGEIGAVVAGVYAGTIYKNRKPLVITETITYRQPTYGTAQYEVKDNQVKIKSDIVTKENIYIEDKPTPSDVSKKVGTIVSVGAYTLTPLGVATIPGTTWNAVDVLREPTMKIGDRPSNVENADWDKYTKDVEEYNKQLKSSKIKAGITLGVIAVGAGYVGYKYATQPVNKITTLTQRVPTPRQGAGVVVRNYKLPNEQIIKQSNIRYVKEYTPAYLQETTTRWRSWFGLEAPKSYSKLAKFVPERTVYGETPFNIYGDNPAYFVEKVSGRKFGTIQKTTSEGLVKIDVKNYNQLSKIDKYLLKKKYGEIIPTESNLYIAQSETMELGRATAIQKASSKEITFIRKQYGKQITDAKKLIEIGKPAETELTKSYLFKINSKDVTNPYARASGKVESIGGKVIEYKEIIEVPGAMKVDNVINVGGLKITKTNPEINFVKNPGTKKTPFSDTFVTADTVPIVKQVPSLTSKQVADIVSKIPATKTGMIPKITSTTTSLSTVPASVSAFAGMGMYERTEGGQLPGVRDIIITKQPTMEITKTIYQPAIKSAEVFKFSEVQKPAEVTKLRPSEKVIPIERVTPIEKVVPIEKITPIERLTTKKLNPPKIPKPKTHIIPIIDFPSSGKKKDLGQVKQSQDSFEVFVKKAGKDVSIGKAVSKIGAGKKLSEELFSTLRASGFVTQAGTETKIKPSELGIKGDNFRLSKKNKFVVVEKKEKRLKRGTREVPEIKAFKKSKGGFFK